MGRSRMTRMTTTPKMPDLPPVPGGQLTHSSLGSGGHADPVSMHRLAAAAGSTRPLSFSRTTRPAQESRPYTVRLTERDLRVLVELGRWRVLTAEQLHRRHFHAQGRRRVWNRLRELRLAGYVGRRVWGFDPERHVQHAGYLATARGLRAVGMDL